MDLTSGYPYWPVKSGLLGVYPPLRDDLRCDVAVIGAGITGALVAHHLVEAGVDVVVLDKRDVGGGSTSASTALLQYEIDTPLHELIELVGTDHAVRAYMLCRDAIYKLEELAQAAGIGCEFERKQSLYFASSRWDVKALKKEHAARRAHGINVDLLDRNDIEARFSFSAPAALYSYDAAQVDAYKLAHGLLANAAKRGVRVYDRSEVTGWEVDKCGVTLTSERGCRVAARTVVFAAGYEAQRYLKRQVTKLRSSYAPVSEPIEEFSGWHEQCLIWETARPYVYLRTTTDGRAIIGGEDDSLDIPTRRDAAIGRKVKKLTKRFAAMFPHIPLDVAFAWAGTFGETKDGLAYIGATDEQPGALFALGYGGNGITFSVVAADIIRDLYLGRPNPDAKRFCFER